MERDFNIAGFTSIAWGILIIIPLYFVVMGKVQQDVFVCITLECAFMISGVTILKKNKWAWSLILLLFSLVAIYFVANILNLTSGTYSGRRLEWPFLALLAVWMSLNLFTMYSIVCMIKRTVVQKMNISQDQVVATIIAIVLAGPPWAIHLIHSLNKRCM
ncbi:hypothetical protein WBG78_22445 [Chryseolinea sp. T2]|uniref:hypothetical protein n=1 Tax=Chryseolinea sp. T2 TaxID=3129255 RepID=UPI003078595B